MGPELPIAIVAVIVWALWRADAADQVGAVDPSLDEVLEVLLEQAEEHAKSWEEEARQARRDLVELMEQLGDVERGLRSLDEALDFARGLPTEAEV